MTRTVRLALVMNGGISLAVWMGGVAKELDLAMRASQGRDDGVADGDRAHYETWREVFAQEDVRIEIDIVAGTSAGGLNGAILATSHAFGAPLPNLKEMWRTSASITPGRLLPPATESSSVLNGGFFARKVVDVLAGIRGGRTDGAPFPITLFVTGTALGDHVRRFRDSFAQAFRSPDHRRVYRFRSQPPSNASSEFEDSFPALGLAARASAGFPVAFAPVRETPQLLRHALGQRDTPAWLIDGGVLDNAPFGPVLDEIVSRPVDTEVERIVVYVVPSDGGERAARHVHPPSPADDADSNDRPPSWSTVLRSALSFPSEADFRDDLDDLTRIFATADARRTAARLALRSVVGADVDGEARAALVNGAGTLRPLYFAQEPDYERAGFVERIQGRSGRAVRLEPLLPGQAAPAGAAAVDEFGHAAAERMVRNLLADLRDRLAKDSSAELGTAAGEVSRALGVLVEQREAIEDEVAAQAGNAESEELTKLLDDALLEHAAARNDAVASAVAAYAGAVGASGDVVREAVEAVEIVTQALAPQVRPAPPPFKLLRLGPDNSSPLAPNAVRYGQLKLYGTRLGHFGAFVEEDWRDWDWAWGRLDAAAQQGRALALDDDRIRVLQQGVWDVEGSGRDLDAETERVGKLEDQALRRAVGRATVDGLLDSASRMLGTPHAGQSELLTSVGAKAAAILSTR